MLPAPSASQAPEITTSASSSSAVTSACGAIWVRADGYDLIPVNSGPTTFRTFLYVQQVAHFAKGETLVGDSLTTPKKAAA